MLPNLPALSGDWQNEFLFPTVNAVDWNKILVADPTRWAVRFLSTQSSQVLITPYPEPTFTDGILLGGNQFIDFFYKDFGPLVQQEWYAFDKGGAFNILVIASYIRKLSPRDLAVPGESANVS